MRVVASSGPSESQLPPLLPSLLLTFVPLLSQPRIITADTQIGGRQVPAALNVPFGNLFFGFDVRPPPGSAEEEAAKAEAENAPPVPFAGVGSGNTLSGRARTGAALPAGAAPTTSSTSTRASSVATEAKPNVPFSGAGNTLSGRKKVETIEIDD